MQLFVLSLFVVTALADRLENTYLPPNSAKDAGGNGNFINSPPTQYGAPNGNSYSNNQSPDARAAILRSDNENNGDGSYHFNFETENKIQHEETGELRNVDNKEVTVVKGSYSYTGPDGIVYTVTYIADENGFQAIGDHIPTPPPVPEAIQRSQDKHVQQGHQDSEQGYSQKQQGRNEGYQY